MNGKAIKKIRLESERPNEDAVRARIHDYIARTGLSQPDFARRINYSYDTLRCFLTGRYHRIGGSSRNVIAAAEEHMQRYPIGRSKRVQGEIYDIANMRIIHETFERLLKKPIVNVLYGPPGSGKTFGAEHEIAQINLAPFADPNGGRRAFYIYARQNIRPRGIVERVAVACGSRVNSNIDKMLSGLAFDNQDKRVVLVIDEAQHLSLECLETLRELLDRPPYFSLLLMGSHDIKRFFEQFSATLLQWHRRILTTLQLPGLEKQEARGIVEREIGSLLAQLMPRDAAELAGYLIASATVADDFNGGKPYINIDTLLNALDQIKVDGVEQALAETRNTPLEAIA